MLQNFPEPKIVVSAHLAAAFPLWGGVGAVILSQDAVLSVGELVPELHSHSTRVCKWPSFCCVSTACKSQMTLGKEAAGHTPSLV